MGNEKDHEQCSAGNAGDAMQGAKSALAECIKHGELRGRHLTQIFNPTERRLIVAALLNALPQTAPELPAAKEIEALISDFTEPDWDTKTAFASPRRSWIVQCLRAALSLPRPK